jgi:hypothetical protein
MIGSCFVFGSKISAVPRRYADRQVASTTVPDRRCVAWETASLRGSINCNHSTTMNADHMPDDTPIRALGSRMVCTKCGHVGADVRPDWSPHVNKRHV